MCLALTLVMLNKLRCHAQFSFSANQIAWSRILILIHILNVKQCRSRSIGFFRSQLIWIYTVCKSRVYLGSAGQGLNWSTSREKCLRAGADSDHPAHGQSHPGLYSLSIHSVVSNNFVSRQGTP